MAGKVVRPVHPLSRLCARLLPAAVAVLLQHGLGRFVLQSGSQLLHQSQALQERRHLLQHWPGLLLLHLSGRVHWNRLRIGQRWLHRHPLSQRRHLSGPNQRVQVPLPARVLGTAMRTIRRLMLRSLSLRSVTEGLEMGENSFAFNSFRVWDFILISSQFHAYYSCAWLNTNSRVYLQNQGQPWWRLNLITPPPPRLQK